MEEQCLLSEICQVV